MSKNDSDLASYYKDGATWEMDIVRNAKRSKSVAWFLTIIMTFFAGISVITLVLLLPLKSFEPYIVVVDKNTGYTEVRNALTRANNLEDLAAITQANVVRYIRHRESYDPFRIEENFEIAAILSTDNALNDLNRLYASNSRNNPQRVYGTSTQVYVDIASVTFGNDQTAIVRFSTTEKQDTREVRKNWVSIVKFRYTNTPQSNAWRFENPLGFQVYDYRRDQETVGNGS